MDSVQLFAQTQGGFDYSSYIELDLFEAEPIKITKSIQAVEDPQATTSSFSQSYRLPNTSTNGKFFKAVFNVNSTDFNAVEKANAYINVNGAYFISGNIRLTNIITNPGTGKIEYEIIFYGQTSTFASVVGPKDLSQISMTEYTHPASYINIRNSWINGLFNGDIVYPLAEWGYTYNKTTKQPNITTLSRYNPTTGVKGFTNSINPLDTRQFKPAIRAKVIWDKIFKDAGFTYTSNFLNSAFFRSIYMISTNTASALSEAELRADVVAKNKAMNLLQYNTIEFGLVSFDNANSVNLTNSTYTAPFTGVYQIRMQLNAIYATDFFNPDDSYVVAAVEVLNNGQVAALADGYLYGTNYGLGSDYLYTEFFSGPTFINLGGGIFQFTIVANQGDIISFRIFPQFGFQYFDLTNLSSITIQGPDVLDPAGYLPVQYKQLEFIKGINDRFKLMWEPDPQNPTNFFIEPWVSWINGGEQKDWTNKLDESADVTLTPLFTTQPREYIFKDSEETDVYNFAYQQTNKETFGQLNQDSGIEVITGKKEIKSIFAPLQVAPIGNSEDFLIPHFAKDTETERQPIQVKPRLGFYNGLIPAPVTWYMKNANVSTAQTTYPLLSNFDSFPFNTSSFDISWANVPQFWNPDFNFGPSATGGTGATGPFNGRTDRTAYNNYWSSWFNTTYDPYGRIMKGTFVLDSVDVQTLAFNDKIFIKDSWWLPLKVNDFVVGTKQKTKVELLKLGNVGVSIDTLNPVTYYPFTMTYNSTGATAACCEAAGSYNEVVYSLLTTPANQSFLYSDNAGVVSAPAGFYTYDGNVYTVNQSGLITATAACNPAECGTFVQFVDVAYSADSPEDMCCATVATASVYYSGTYFYTSTALYGNEELTIPVFSGWYGIDGNAVYVGENGIITQIANCEAYDCANRLPFPMILNIANDFGSPSIQSACCVYPVSGSGSIGIGTIYSDAPFPDGEFFYYDPGKIFPVAPFSPSQLLSDGEQYVQVFQGDSYGVGECPPPTTCSSRTYDVNFSINNASSSSSNISVVWQISWNNAAWFYNGDASYTIPSGSGEYLTVKYDPASFVRFIMTSADTGKVIAYDFEGNLDITLTPSTFTSNSVGPCANFGSILATITIDDL